MKQDPVEALHGPPSGHAEEQPATARRTRLHRVNPVAGEPSRDSRCVGATIEGVRSRQAELREEILVRVHAISDFAEELDPDYLLGLRAAASAGAAFAVETLEAAAAGREIPEVPLELVAQAQLAARNDVPLDAVLRRYSGGQAVVTAMLLEEADRNDLSRKKLSVLWRGLAEGLDRVMARVGEEFQRELERRRKVVYDGTNQVRKLLKGEAKEPGELRYCLSGWHVALICAGRDSRSTLRERAGALDRALLLVTPSEHLSWAWVGGHRPFDPKELDTLLAALDESESTVIGCGEPACGLSGWRLSHHQATSAMLVARSSPTRVARYSEVALVAAALQDEVLGRTLGHAFIEPFSLDRDNGRAAKATLRAYFDASRNISSTAAALGVTRRTVANRLAAAEERLGKSLSRFAAEIQTAVRLDEIESYAQRTEDRHR